jgi:hypothetical protein
MTGAGSYDPECTLVRKLTSAALVVIIIYDGIKGSGFAVQSTSQALQRKLPEFLRRAANEIEADL